MLVAKSTNNKKKTKKTNKNSCRHQEEKGRNCNLTRLGLSS